MNTQHLPIHKIRGLLYFLGLFLGATLLTSSAQGFFPSLPPTNTLHQGGGTPPSSSPGPGSGALPPGTPPSPTGTLPQGGGTTPAGPPGGATPPTSHTPSIPTPPPPGVPEMDPGSVAGALGILISGVLMLLDRRGR